MARLSIIIKTFNEEKNVRRAIESSIAATEPYAGEIIIADSASSDRTVEIAKQYPVIIVELKNPGERRCGVGPELGYPHSQGEYVYILDGDMELKAPFLQRAIGILDADTSVAGVGGYIHEMRVDNLELQGRVKRIKRPRSNETEEVLCLNGGGLYRRSAIEDVGYISDRNLHAFEEYDLGARLRTKGWRLVLLADRAVDHYSYPMGSWPLLWYRTRTGRFLSPGELLRAAVDAHYVYNAVREIRILQLIIGVWLYWGFALLALNWVRSDWMVMFFFSALGIPMIGMAIRQKSSMLAVYSIVTWHFYAIAFIIGFFSRRRSPSELIDSTAITPAPSAVAF